jgi:hypothetical protein
VQTGDTATGLPAIDESPADSGGFEEVPVQTGDTQAHQAVPPEQPDEDEDFDLDLDFD